VAVLRIALLASLGVSFVLLVIHVPERARQWGWMWERIQDAPAAEREASALMRPAPGLPRGMPGLLDLASLLDPLMEDAGTMELSFVFVAPGNEATVHGVGLLFFHFSPKLEPVVYLPMDTLRRWVEGSEAGRVHAGLLNWIGKREVFLFYDVPEPELAALLDRMREKIGQDVLVRGRSVGGRHHVLLLRSLVEAIQRGDPVALRYGALLP